jgi:hypothetical protein
MNPIFTFIILCLVLVSCSRDKEEKNALALAQKAEQVAAEQVAAEQVAAEKAAAEKAAADRLTAINKIIKFLNTVDTSVRGDSKSSKSLCVTKSFTYSESDESLCFEELKLTFFSLKDGTTTMLFYSGYKIFLREANPEIKISQDESNYGITKLSIESLVSTNTGDVITSATEGDILEDNRYKEFKKQPLTELKKTDAKKGAKPMTLPTALAPRFKQALSDLLQLHGVEPLAY